ncbi:hypothetical protein ONZ45_g16551 [Pleurotus djamor]|nr:hypothetical protein ONZ45_g16551 [Pleurotus djamor]
MTVIDLTDDNPQPRKRARQTQNNQNKDVKSHQNRLFVPFRALGLVTNHVPCVLQTRSFKGATEGPRLHILTCLGSSWALWEGGKMTLLFVGPEASSPITSLAMDGDFIWASSAQHVIKYLRGKEVQRITNPLGTDLSFITIFADQLISLPEDGRKTANQISCVSELSTQVSFEPDFLAASVLHPATYLNKVLVSSHQGSMQLWNIRSQTCIYKFTLPQLCSNVSSSGPSTSITALTQSPAIDVVGVGFSSGEISVYDIRADERLLRMFMDGGKVTALGFRSDGQPIMASASSSGHLAIWDLNAGGKLLHMVRGAHDGSISTVEWVPGQPLLVTSGEDNSVKQWLFDSPTAVPRVLKSRSGHQAPPHLIRYYGDDGKQLLTASRDRSLRCTSVVRDSRSFELSQGSLAKKASSRSIPLTSLKYLPVTSLSYSTTRAKDWDDVLTVHSEDSFARTWSLLAKRSGKYTFKAYDGEKGKGKAAAPVGSAKASSSAKNVRRSITGLATDALNRVVIASTLDGTLNWFDFHQAKLDHTLILPAVVISITLHRDSGLIAAVCDDMVIRVIDIETRRIVREFGGFKGRILDITFSPDSRWLVTTSLDSIIRTFDLPSGCLIDAFRTSSVATSVAFSPTNGFLATSHLDSVGVYLWANRAQYAEMTFKSIQESDIAEASLPSMQAAAEDDALESLSALNIEETPADPFTTPAQLDGDLITLTLLPRSRWQTLLNLEVIQQRNKPKEPPKAPEQAPFFLPTLPGVEHRFAIEPTPKDDDGDKKTRRLERSVAHLESHFVKQLSREEQSGDYEVFFNYMKTLSPAAIDLELHSLTSLSDIRLFFNALRQRLLSHRDFEAVQTIMCAFIKIQGDIIVANSELRDELVALKEVQEKESQRILELLASSLGTLSFLRDTI